MAEAEPVPDLNSCLAPIAATTSRPRDGRAYKRVVRGGSRQVRRTQASVRAVCSGGLIFYLRQGRLGGSVTVRRRRPSSPDRGHRDATSKDPGDNPAGDATDETVVMRFVAATRGRATTAQRWLAKYQGIPVVDVVLGTFRRDRRAAGSVMSSALAFRLFLFFLPLLLLTIGVAGVASEVVDARSVNRAAGISGSWRSRSARHFISPGSPDGSRCCSACGASWLLDGHLAGCCTRQARPRGGCRRATHARLRAVGAVAGLVCTIGVIAILIGRIRESLGLGIASCLFSSRRF